MTPQENQLLQDFLAQLARAQVATKDPDAQALIVRALAQQPDAAYLLVQRALLLEQALKQAQAEIAQLQEQGSSFIGGGRTQSQSPTPAPGAAPVSAYTPSAQVSPRAAASGSGWGSFLGNAAAPAAGVAGGAFLFQGLENLFGHGGSGGSGFLGGSAPTGPVEDTTINNYGSVAASPDLASADDPDTGLDQSGPDDSGDDSSWT